MQIHARSLLDDQLSDSCFLNFVQTQSRKADLFQCFERRKKSLVFFPMRKQLREDHTSQSLFHSVGRWKRTFRFFGGSEEERRHRPPSTEMRSRLRRDIIPLRYLYHGDRGPRWERAGAERTLGRAAHFHQFVTGARWRVLRY